MGDVAAVLKVMLEAPDTDVKEVKENIERSVKEVGFSLQSMDEKALAFGIKMIEVLVLIRKGKTGTDALEDRLRSIKGVASVEPGDVSLV